LPHVTSLRADDPGRVGRYQLAGRISGMPSSGSVYLGMTDDGTEVTVTLLRSDWTGNPAARDRFAEEAAVARRVAPFCAARVLDAGIDGPDAFLVSEFVPGLSLAEAVTATGPIEGADLQALAIGSVTGLAAIHQAGLAHGGFSPQHVILSAEGPRVIEFGISPPSGTANPAADMLAWARTISYAATGSPSASLEDLAFLPLPLYRVVARCLAAEPADRPPARLVVLNLLGDAEPPTGLLAEASRRAAMAIPTPPPEPAPPPTAWPAYRPMASRSRGSRIAMIAGAIACVLAAGIVVRIVQNAGRPSGLAPASSADGGTTPSQAAPSGKATPSRARQSSSATAIIPLVLAGTWAGQVRQANPADTFSVKVRLVAGARSGTVAYSGTTFACSGRLSLMSATGSTLTMDQGITTGRKTCANGVVTLQPGAGSSGTSVMFSFRGKAGPTAFGTLARQ